MRRVVQTVSADQGAKWRRAFFHWVSEVIWDFLPSHCDWSTVPLSKPIRCKTELNHNLVVIIPHFPLNPSHPNTSMHILHTLLHTFPKVLTRRIYFTIRRFFSWWSFSLFLLPECVIQEWYFKENLDSSHS